MDYIFIFGILIAKLFSNPFNLRFSSTGFCTVFPEGRSLRVTLMPRSGTTKDENIDLVIK